MPLQIISFASDFARQWVARGVGTLGPGDMLKRMLITVPTMLGLSFAVMLIYSIAQAVLCAGAIESAAGKKIDPMRSTRAATAQFFSVAFLALVISLSFSVGLVFLLLPAIVIWLVTSVAMPCAVTENIGAFDSMQRSVTLTEGSRTTVFLCMFVYVAAALAAAMISGIPQNALMGRDIAAANLFAPAAIGARMLSLVVAGLVVPLHGIIGGVLYARLREIRENASLESVAAVFAP